jgi:hypothetical protein
VTATADPAGWQWRDTGSGSGRIQRVVVATQGRTQAAYAVFLDHAGDCQLACGSGDRCFEGEALWRAYRDATDVVHP